MKIFYSQVAQGMIAVQLAKKMGAKVIAISKRDWVKYAEFGGADYVINDYGKVVDQVKDITQGKMADVVLNSLDISQTWDRSYASIGINGRWVTLYS